MEQPNIGESNKFIPNKFDLLRKGIIDLKRQELEKKALGKPYDLHFELIDPDALNDNDLTIYEKYQNGSLTEQEFFDFQEKFMNEYYDHEQALASEQNSNNPRLEFRAWLANALSTRAWMEKWSKERKIE